jgi:hypothetical protein
MVGKERQRVAIPMIQAGNEWIADWDSRVASGGPVYAHARTAAPLPIYAMDFVLVLETNKANPLPAP